MKVRVIILTVVACFIGVAVCFAQNPFMGTWKLNESKSKLARGAPKHNKVVYETEGIDIKITTDGIDGAGNSTHSVWIGKFDGKDYPVKGDSNQASLSYKRKGINEIDFQVKLFPPSSPIGSAVTNTGRIVVSHDGKRRTVTSHGTDARGKKYTSKSVYDRQWTDAGIQGSPARRVPDDR